MISPLAHCLLLSSLLLPSSPSLGHYNCASPVLSAAVWPKLQGEKGFCTMQLHDVECLVLLPFLSSQNHYNTDPCIPLLYACTASLYIFSALCLLLPTSWPPLHLYEPAVRTTYFLYEPTSSFVRTLLYERVRTKQPLCPSITHLLLATTPWTNKATSSILESLR